MRGFHHLRLGHRSGGGGQQKTLPLRRLRVQAPCPLVNPAEERPSAGRRWPHTPCPLWRTPPRLRWMRHCAVSTPSRPANLPKPAPRPTPPPPARTAPGAARGGNPPRGKEGATARPPNAAACFIRILSRTSVTCSTE